jgi:hypothetical protein
MPETVVGTTRGLLEGVLAETDDPDQLFELRSALQLLYVVEEKHAAARSVLNEADLGEGLGADLRDLGYLD